MGEWPHTGAHRTSVHRRGEEGEGGRKRKREGDKTDVNCISLYVQGGLLVCDCTCLMNQSNVMIVQFQAVLQQSVGGVQSGMSKHCTTLPCMKDETQ